MTSRANTLTFNTAIDDIDWSSSFGFPISPSNQRLLDEALEQWKSSIRSDRRKTSPAALKQLACRLRTTVEEVRMVLASYL